jgi:hypothetical protein
MHRASVFFTARFVVGFWLALIIALLSLLIFNAPSVPNLAPFESVSIKAHNSRIYLPNRSFTCTETEQQFLCQTKIQNRPLDLSFTKGTDYKYNLSNCRVLYNGQPANCQRWRENYAPILAFSFEMTGLNLNSQQLQQIKQKNWAINIFMPLGETGLMRMGRWLSVAAGISIAFLTSLHPKLRRAQLTKLLLCLGSGLGTTLLTMLLFTVLLLVLGYAD